MTGLLDPATFPLPLTVDDISAQWLTAALRQSWPGVTVTDFREVDRVEGTATKVLVELDYQFEGPPTDLPSRIWVKGGFAAHREYAGALGVYTGEVRFYAEAAPLYSLHIPRSYFAVAQDDPVQGIVGLEDLRPYDVEFARSTRPMTAQQASAGLEFIARLHGQTWGDTRPAAAGIDVVMGRQSDSIWQEWFNDLPSYFSAPRAFAAPVALHDPDRLIPAFLAYRKWVQADPSCLLHGDCHVGNAYIEKDGTVGFVDWQTVAVGRWVHDVNYFLVSALDPPDRRRHERDLLGVYLKVLAAHGGPCPTPDEAWEDYRKATVYGFLCFLCNPDVWQPEDVNTATFAKFAAAMLDHDTYGLYGV